MSETTGPPIWIPLAFPVGNIISMIWRDENESPPVIANPKGTSDIAGHLTLICGALRSYLMGLCVIYLMYDGYDYPAFGSGKELKREWIIPIIIRNIIGLFVIAGGWDYVLYFSPLKNKLTKYKFNKTEYPTKTQWFHDIFWSFTATIAASIIEIILCYCYSNNILYYNSKSIFNDPINIIFIITITHYRVIHFWVIHRMIHPWRTKIIPDIGYYLYKYVHTLHHKSYNPSSFSGTSMHPIESILYYSAAFLWIPFVVHPIIPLSCIIDCAVGAWIGHDGFGWPGGADYFHQLHHWHFDCNYGNPQVPIDYWFGTYIGCKQDLKKCWKNNKNVGRAANEKICKTH